MGIPNSMRILYKISLLTKSYAFLKCINSWCTVLSYSHFLSGILMTTEYISRWPATTVLHWKWKQWGAGTARSQVSRNCPRQTASNSKANSDSHACMPQVLIGGIKGRGSHWGFSVTSWQIYFGNTVSAGTVVSSSDHKIPG